MIRNNNRSRNRKRSKCRLKKGPHSFKEEEEIITEESQSQSRVNFELLFGGGGGWATNGTKIRVSVLFLLALASSLVLLLFKRALLHVLDDLGCKLLLSLLLLPCCCCHYRSRSSSSSSSSSSFVSFASSTSSSFSSSSFPLFLLVFLIILSGILVASPASSVYAQSCIDDSSSASDSGGNEFDVRYEFDQAMFDELNMQETLESLYRSCYREDYQSIKREKSSKRKFAQCSSSTTTSTSTSTSSSSTSSSTSSQKPSLKPTVNDILYQLFNNADYILSPSFLDRMDRVCKDDGGGGGGGSESGSDVSDQEYINRLLLLFNYRDTLCGFIYHNSVKSSHLHEYVLRGRLRNDTNDSNTTNSTNSFSSDRFETTLENNTVITNQNVKSEFVQVAEVAFEFDSDRLYESTAENLPVTEQHQQQYDNDDDEDEYNRNTRSTAVRRGGKRARKKLQYQNESYYRIIGSSPNEKTGKKLIVLKSNKMSASTKLPKSSAYDSTVKNRIVTNPITPMSRRRVNESSFDLVANMSQLSDEELFALNRTNSSALFSTANSTNSTNSTVATSTSPPRVIKTTFLNNCTLILLNIYLLAYKASCNYEDFVDSLNHYDCLKNNFSVKSNCTNCKEAYNKWLCSSIIPYYKEDEPVKPCLRYCYNVQNQCPFFRPVDIYGGQPVFHCRNVVQVNEWRPDGYEDDDENYLDDNLLDVDTCYAECLTTPQDLEQFEADEGNGDFKRIRLDLTDLIERIKSSSNSSDETNIQHGPYSQSDDQVLVKNFNGRFPRTNECLFNLHNHSSTHRLFSSTSNYLLYIGSLLLYLLIIRRLVR